MTTLKNVGGNHITEIAGATPDRKPDGSPGDPKIFHFHDDSAAAYLIANRPKEFVLLSTDHAAFDALCDERNEAKQAERAKAAEEAEAKKKADADASAAAKEAPKEASKSEAATVTKSK